MSAIHDIRPSPIAGSWYEGSPDLLASVVDKYLQAVTLPDIAGEIIAVISPHAGHVYSGQVAAYAFAVIQHLHPDVVVIISPMHQPYPQPLLTVSHASFGTPLGEIPIDHELIDVINQHIIDHGAHAIQSVRGDREHSIEIELPFLQRIYRHEFKLVPIMVRDQSPQMTMALGSALFDSLQDKNAIVVASTDLSHFYPLPVANKLDRRMLDEWGDLSISGIYQVDQQGKGYACGLGAVTAVMQYATLRGAKQSIILNYATSADVTGDETSVVGYASAAIIK